MKDSGKGKTLRKMKKKASNVRLRVTSYFLFFSSKNVIVDQNTGDHFLLLILLHIPEDLKNYKSTILN